MIRSAPQLPVLTAALAALLSGGLLAPTSARAEPKRVQIGKNVSIEVNAGRRRVLVESKVCLREGMLELLMCRKNTKEHEAILSADIDARDVHKALLAIGAEPGHTFRETRPKPRLPAGTKVKIMAEYEDENKKLVRVPVQSWIRDSKTKADLNATWVFAGSLLIPDPMDKEKPPFYVANDGDVITVCNFEGALLDLPIYSSKNNASLSFEPVTDKIPPLETKVTLSLEPEIVK